ncbi:MAG: group III truncated hemoglobin [Flavobacteriaceae bacterium]|nr:group III truncated hemoglobin [Flavobacteriaceae bacterium]MDG2503328.1 group III truncated hemoglobin [Flavobacteriaceae bacterium]
MDANILMIQFYEKIRSDELLGPIFNTVIKNWPEHLEHLTDFWETQLFFVGMFKGNPLKKHVEVDSQTNHFGVWLNYWFETFDFLFEGERVQVAKNRARIMGSHLYLKLLEARPKVSI